MTVSLKATSRKYHGRKAETYDAIRTKQLRWEKENEAVTNFMVGSTSRSVLDVPVGTGRFLALWHKLGMRITGLDVSDEMVALARRKWRKGMVGELVVGDFLTTDAVRYDKYDVVAMIRILDLIDEEAMRAFVKKAAELARREIVLTIRFGPKYVPKANTAEHDETKFKRMVSNLGWKEVGRVPIFNAGWNVLHLRRK